MDSESHGPTLIEYALAVSIISVIALGLRFWSRALLQPERGPRLWWDDWTALSSLVIPKSPAHSIYLLKSVQPFILGLNSLVLYATSLGFPKPAMELTSSNRAKLLQVEFAFYFLYDTSISLPKTSVLFFYSRVFETQQTRFRYALWFSHFLVVSWLIAIPLSTVFVCDPVEKQWKPATPGHCHSNNVWRRESSIPSVVIDLILLLLPMPMLWRLQMTRIRRIMIVSVFACGYWSVVVPCVLGVLR